MNSLPYEGFALPVSGVYDDSSLPIENFRKAIDIIKQKSKKHIWPWIFFNRIVGNSQRTNKNAEKPYFLSFSGLDILGDKGALGKFFDTLDKALTIAKNLGAPGIFLDPEFYNSYENLHIDRLEHLLGMEKSRLVISLRHFGAEIADHINDRYPEAIVWSAFTGFWHKKSISDKRSEQWRSVTWIFEGLLDRAKERGYPLTLVSGGEWFFGYCYESLSDLVEVHKEREKLFSPYISKYPNLLLGGTVAPWKDSDKREGYFGKGPKAFYRCRKSTLETAEDFIPIIRQLRRTYRYVWIYGASKVGFFPFRESGAQLNTIIQRAKD